ncbi:MAG: hypothetical protein ACI8QZ_001944 [Chlamydiales bacterium]|jgi:hypothetical protein
MQITRSMTAAACLGLLASVAVADGTEALGDPSIAIADGSGTIIGGIGLIGGPDTIRAHDNEGGGPVVVPAGVTIMQALLYWEGTSQTQNQQGATDDIMVDNGGGAVMVTGTRIGGPTLFFVGTSIGDGWSATYRADITDLVAVGDNNLLISGLDFDTRNNGAGVIIIVDDGETTGTMGVKDGNDVAFGGFAGLLQTTAPISFDIIPADEARVADLSLLVSSVALEAGEFGRPTIIDVKIFEGAVEVGSVQLVDKLSNFNADEWDSYSTREDVLEDLMIPAFADSMTVQCLSEDSGTGPFQGRLVASLAWCSASLSVPSIPDEPGEIGDTVYCDLNNNGVQDNAEPGIPGVTVNLRCAGDDGMFDTMDDLTDSQETDANGNYLFTDIPAGMCMVVVDPTTAGDKVPGICPLDFLVDLMEGQSYLDADFCFVESPEMACRMTGVGNATFEEPEGGMDFYTLGGQIGAPSADQPQPYGNWGHTQHRGPDGRFSFHGGTNAHGDDTFIASVVCSDPGYCNPARPAPAKQLDATGVGLFSNARELSPLMAAHVIVQDSRHWFSVHFEDLGEPGGGTNSTEGEEPDCPPEGSAGSLADCGCSDFYSIKIHANADPASAVIYETYGYIRRGNVQIHPPVGESGQ